MKLPGMVTFATPRVPPRPTACWPGSPSRPGCICTCRSAPASARSVPTTRSATTLGWSSATSPPSTASSTYTARRRPNFQRQIYIGGGTPTLCLDQLADLLTGIDAVGERAIEVLPNHMTEQLAERLIEIGITHVSIGAQSFDSQVLRHLRRPNTVAINRRALDVAIGRFECVDVDLMFDVGYQEPEVLLHDLRTCFDAGVDQVSTYPVMRFGYTPFGKADHDRRAEHQTLRAAAELAAEHGFERRSVWTFNRIGGPVYSSITREFYLGLGAGSATYSGRTFDLNHFGIEAYIEPLERGVLPIARVARLGPVQSAAYYLFWQCYTGSIDLNRFRLLFGRQLTLRTIVRALDAIGWIEPRDGE